MSRLRSAALMVPVPVRDSGEWRHASSTSASAPAVVKARSAAAAAPRSAEIGGAPLVALDCEGVRSVRRQRLHPGEDGGEGPSVRPEEAEVGRPADRCPSP